MQENTLLSPHGQSFALGTVIGRDPWFTVHECLGHPEDIIRRPREEMAQCFWDKIQALSHLNPIKYVALPKLVLYRGDKPEAFVESRTPGEPLAKTLTATAPWDVQEAERFFVDLTTLVEHLHRLGICGVVDPHHIHIDHHGSPWIASIAMAQALVKVKDVQHFFLHEKRWDSAFGLPPESLESPTGAITAGFDHWQFGTLLFFAFTGIHPHAVLGIGPTVSKELITKRRFIHREDDLLPSDAPPLARWRKVEELPATLMQLWQETFKAAKPHYRPALAEWVNVLAPPPPEPSRPPEPPKVGWLQSVKALWSGNPTSEGGK